MCQLTPVRGWSFWPRPVSDTVTADRPVPSRSPQISTCLCAGRMPPNSKSCTSVWQVSTSNFFFKSVTFTKCLVKGSYGCMSRNRKKNQQFTIYKLLEKSPLIYLMYAHLYTEVNLISLLYKLIYSTDSESIPCMQSCRALCTNWFRGHKTQMRSLLISVSIFCYNSIFLL